MSIERWYGGRLWRLLSESSAWVQNALALNSGAPLAVVVSVPATYTPGDVFEIEHALGRVPRGMQIVNQVLPSSATAGVGWWREEDDAAWTERSAAVRFDTADAALLVFFY